VRRPTSSTNPTPPFMRPFHVAAVEVLHDAKGRPRPSPSNSLTDHSKRGPVSPGAQRVKVNPPGRREQDSGLECVDSSCRIVREPGAQQVQPAVVSTRTRSHRHQAGWPEARRHGVRDFGKVSGFVAEEARCSRSTGIAGIGGRRQRHPIAVRCSGTGGRAEVVVGHVNVRPTIRPQNWSRKFDSIVLGARTRSGG